MSSEPMSARKAFELLLGGEYAINGLPQDSYERAKAVMSAIVDQSEPLDALLAAAWKNGREEGLRLAMEIVARQAQFRYGYGAQTKEMEGLAMIRLHPPTPEQLKEIR